MARSTFNLRLWFGISAAAVIIVMASGFALLMSHFLSTRMLEREAAMTRQALESVLKVEGTTARAFANTIETNPALASFVAHIEGMPDLIRVNLYDPQRRIVWSTDRQLIGRTFADNPELDEALAGEVLTEVGSASDDDKEEHEALAVADDALFIEAYIPMRDTAVQGVVELYAVPTALTATIRDGQRMILGGSAAAAFVLFLTLFGIVDRGARVIQGQQAELSRMEALAAVGEMASAVAHSLRNPLAGIRSSAELLAHEGEEQRDTAQDITREVDRMDRYVRELLDYSRLESGTVQLVDPAELVRDILLRHVETLCHAGMATSVRDERTAAGTVAVDPVLMGQALGNIVVNAVEAMGTDGRLTVTLRDWEQGFEIGFADTGPGFPASILARVSEPFLTTKPRGLGLGLALARRIVERAGGHFIVANGTPQGAVVQVRLPRGGA
ncbi:sensor histidine kinase [Zavarzinia sp. CC-PAN008]|uniref:sensor histidine kinase n=1 Tax=Zavarzinia sp. CC-PAN008 TaxID=3243332 RepID=UPI003F748FED